MRPISTLGMLCLLGACSAGTQWTKLNASPASGPADVLACAKAKLGGIGYQMTSLNDTEYRLTARKFEVDTHRADPRYRRNIDRLEVETAAAADGKTALSVIGRSFAEYQTTRGPTEEEQQASEDVRQSAQAIIDACGTN
jgi:hypothetical protein